MALGKKTGGRQAGTPNKATRELKDFLDRVFTRAFTEKLTVVRNGRRTKLGLEDHLVRSIITLDIDESLLKTLLAYWAGGTPKAVEHTHTGTVKLEQLIAGTADTTEDEDGDS